MWIRKVLCRVVLDVAVILIVCCSTGFLKAGTAFGACRMICTKMFGPLRRSIMKMNLYSVFDTKSGVFDRPWCSVSDGAAIRVFGDMCEDERSGVVAKHPDDFALYRVGSWNDGTAEISPEGKECMITGLEVLSQRSNKVTSLEVGNA